MARPDGTNEEVRGRADDAWTAPAGGASLLGGRAETGLAPSGEYSRARRRRRGLPTSLSEDCQSPTRGPSIFRLVRSDAVRVFAGPSGQIVRAPF